MILHFQGFSHFSPGCVAVSWYQWGEWLAASPLSEEVFDQKRLIVLHIIGLLLVVLATVTLPYLTAGNLMVFTAIR